MLRFIHTADWQIGMKAAGVGLASKMVREARFASLQTILNLAAERSVSLMLVTGDVFEDNAVDRVLVKRVGEMLSRFAGQVFIIPGNHDPLTPGSVWEHRIWNDSPNIQVIRDAKPIYLDNAVLYPCPLHEKYSSRNPVSWIQAEEGGVPAVGLAHGNVEGAADVSADYPIPRDAAQRTGLDFLALGHWHSFSSYPDNSGVVRMSYSGSHETTKFGERDSGSVSLVEIRERGAVPNIETLRTGRLSWLTLDRILENAGDLAKVVEEIQSLSCAETTLVRVRLNGLLFASDRHDLTALEEALATLPMHGALSLEDLIPAPEDDSWIESLPMGPLRETAVQLKEIATQSRTAEEKSIGSQALVQLFEIYEKGVR